MTRQWGCSQEMCPYWTGDGCACAVLGIEPASETEADDE